MRMAGNDSTVEESALEETLERLSCCLSAVEDDMEKQRKEFYQEMKVMSDVITENERETRERASDLLDKLDKDLEMSRRSQVDSVREQQERVEALLRNHQEVQRERVESLLKQHTDMVTQGIQQLYESGTGSSDRFGEETTPVHERSRYTSTERKPERSPLRTGSSDRFGEETTPVYERPQYAATQMYHDVPPYDSLMRNPNPGMFEKETDERRQYMSNGMVSGRPTLRRENCIRGEEQFTERFGPLNMLKPRKPKEPVKFDGRIPWEDFINQFEACARFNGWTEREACFQLYTSCIGDALTVLTVNEIKPEEISYNELRRFLAQEYGPRECAESYFQELHRREQRPEESITQLGQAIRKLTTLAHPRTSKEERDDLAKVCFQNAIADPDVRKDVFRARPLTLNEAIRAALESESYYRAERNRKRSRSPSYVRPLSTERSGRDDSEVMTYLKAFGERLEKLVQSSMAREETKRQESLPKTRPRRCYTCNQEGHFARDCQQGNESRSNQRAMERPMDTVRPREETDSWKQK